jgi:hypothetical protein
VGPARFISVKFRSYHGFDSGPRFGDLEFYEAGVALASRSMSEMCPENFAIATADILSYVLELRNHANCKCSEILPMEISPDADVARNSMQRPAGLVHPKKMEKLV